MTSPLLADLNAEQLAAVTLPHESALILAGAGSGKTRVLTTRIAWLIASGQATPFSILAVTFTNNAARALPRRRPAAAVPDPRHAGSARADQASLPGARPRRRALSAARPAVVHRRCQGARTASQRGGGG